MKRLCLDLMKKKPNKHKTQNQPNETKLNKVFQLTWSIAGKCFLGQNVYFIPSTLSPHWSLKEVKCKSAWASTNQTCPGSSLVSYPAFIIAEKCRIQPKEGIAWLPFLSLTQSDFRSSTDLCPDLAVLRKSKSHRFCLASYHEHSRVSLHFALCFVCLLNVLSTIAW